MYSTRGGAARIAARTIAVLVVAGAILSAAVPSAWAKSTLLSITTQVSSAKIAPTNSFHDTATLTVPVGGFAPTGQVEFRVFGPDDATCSTRAKSDVGKTLNAAGTTADSGAFATSELGTYRVIATYLGDSNYDMAQTACNDPNESVVVAKNTLTVLTHAAPATVTLPSSGAFNDTATLTAPAGAPNPTGTISFSLYGPGDTTCSALPVFTSPPASVDAPVSDPFTPSLPGTYRFVATYPGDQNYDPTTTSCGDPAESVAVRYAAPALVAQVSPSTLALGSAFQDTATLAAAPAGQPIPTGSVAFSAYAPGDTTCSRVPVLNSTSLLGAGGSANSGNLTPIAGGAYRVVASYLGDEDYFARATACGDPHGSVSVNGPASVPLSASLTGRASLGAVTVSGTSAVLILICTGTSGQTCPGAVGLVSHVRKRGSKLLAISAAAKRRKPTSKVKLATDAAGLYSVPAGESTKLTLTLNNSARRLLKHFKRLPATVLLNGKRTRNVVFKTSTKPSRKKKRG